MIEKYLEELLAFYPVSHEQDRVLKLLEYVQRHCVAHGLNSEIVQYNSTYNLYAHPHARKASAVMLQAHVDVVPTVINEQKTLSIKDDKLSGRGVYDMLFAVACYMHFIAIHKDSLKNLDIAILLSGDEEFGGENGVKKLLDDGYTTRVCILPDAGSRFGVLTVAAKGAYMARIRVNGVAHHGARPWEGDGASAKLVAFLCEFQKIFDTSDINQSSLTIATLTAGDSENRGPSTALTDLDIRYKDKTDLKRILLELDKMTRKYNAEVIRVNTGNDYKLDTEDPYVQKFMKLYQEHAGQPIELEKAHGSSDARYFADHNIPVILCRPDGGNAHGDNEWLSQKNLQQFYTLLEQYILDVAKIGNKNE